MVPAYASAQQLNLRAAASPHPAAPQVQTPAFLTQRGRKRCRETRPLISEQNHGEPGTHGKGTHV